MVDAISLGGVVAGGFFMDVILWVIGGGLVVGAGFWYFMNYMRFKYVFLEYDTKGNVYVRRAMLTKNAKGIKKFSLKDYPGPEYYLSVKQANMNFKGKPVRGVTWDGMGNLVYLDVVKPFVMDSKVYMETALLEIERTEAVDGQMEAAEKSNLMSTVQKWMVGGLVIIFVFMIIGLIAIAKFGFEQTSTYANAGQSFKEAGKYFEETNTIMRANTIAMNNLVNVLVKDQNITIDEDVYLK